MNSSFVFLRPEVCTKAFVEFTLNFFEHTGVRVDDVAVLTTEEARRHGWVEEHYASTQTFAYADSKELSQLIEQRDEVKSVFFSFFNELWDTAVAEGRLLSAKDAMTVLGNLSPRELSQRWWSNGDFHPAGTTTALGCTPVKLFDGLYVMRLAQEGNLYVVNGFYPAVHEACTVPGANQSVCRMTVSWPESSYTWEQFAAEVVGRPGDPTPDPATGSAAFPATSLRYALYHQCDNLGVHMVKDAWAAPSRSESAPVVMSGLEVAFGPLAALAARRVWTSLCIEDDDFGRQLLQEGVPLGFVERMLRNPVLLQAGEVVSIFDLTAGLTSTQAVRLVSQIYVENEEQLAQAKQAAKEAGEAAPGAIYILDVAHRSRLLPSSGPDTAQPDVTRDTAVVLVKPHACRPAVLALVEEVLQTAAAECDLVVDAVREVTGALVEQKRLVDRHYTVAAHYAMDAEPASIPVSVAAQEAFDNTYGVKWADCVAAGHIFNAAAALHTLGDITTAQLYQQWFLEEEKQRKVELTSEAWVCRVPHPHQLPETPSGVPFFVVNGFYPYLRETYIAPAAKTRCYALSWPERTEEESDGGQSTGTLRLTAALCGRVLDMLKRDWQALGLPHPPDSVNDCIAVSRGAMEAVAQRHVWLGTPLESDAVYCGSLRPRGVSTAPLMQWLGNSVTTSGERAFDLLAGASTSELVRVAREAEQELRQSAADDAVNRAVVLLHPSAATAKSIQHVRDVLARGGVRVLAEGDAFAREASARLLGTASMAGAARLAALGGQQLHAAVSAEAREAFQQTFKKDWETFAEIITGAAVACEEFEVSPTALMKKWSDCDPVRLARHCYVAFVPVYQRYIVNGFYPYLNERYTHPAARAHYFDVEWAESRWTWEDFSTVVVGVKELAHAAAGSLQRSISEGWRELGLAERPCHRAQLSITASSGPLEAIMDRVLWLTNDTAAAAAPTAEERFLADPLTHRLVAEGVPVGTVAYYAAGHRSLALDETKAQERALLAEVSTHKQTSECLRRLKTVSASIQSACKQHYGFFWLQPASALPDFALAIPELLAAHNVRVRSQGELSVDEAQEKALLNGPLSALYRNAWTRAASEVLVSAEEKTLFHGFFGIRWETAVELSIVINAKEAVVRFGEARIMRWWDETPRKTCLSQDLYVGYLETEGVYVLNGFYPYMQSRLHAGSRRTMWFSVTWDAAQMDWAGFQARVIGNADPTEAIEGSLRHHLHVHWEHYGLSMPTDVLESGVQASASPLEAVADRCLWWNIQPEEDVLGRLLLQHGVGIDFLHDVLRNPPVYLRGAVGNTIENVLDAFAMLPHDTVALLQTLREWQSATHVTFLPTTGAQITCPRPLPLPKDDPEAWEEVPTEAQQREAAVARQSTHTALTYPALPLDTLQSTPAQPPVAAAKKAGTESEQDKDKEKEAGPVSAYAVLALSPTFVAPPLAAVGSSSSSAVAKAKIAALEATNVALLKSLVRDVMRSHGVSVVYEGTLSAQHAEDRRVFDGQHRRLLQYGMHDTATDLLAVRKYREAIEKVFGDTFDPAGLRNAVRIAETFDLTPNKVNAVWKYCSPLVRLDNELFVGKVPAEDLFIVNGFATHERNAFYGAPHAKHFMLVHWDERVLSYDGFVDRVVGDAYTEKATSGSVNAALRDAWQQLGFSTAPHPFLGAVHTSNSALAAMHDRRLWLPQGLGFDKDPLGHRAVTEAGVSPYILQWALANPREEHSGSFAVGKTMTSGLNARPGGDGEGAVVRLMDVLSGQGSDITLRLLSSLEVNYRYQQEQRPNSNGGCGAVRNTAFLLVKPHALGRRFARCIEHVLAHHNVRIDEEGDLTGSTLQQSNLVRTLYPAVGAYAARKPQDLALSPGEKARLEAALGVAWLDMVFGGLVYNAYDALEKLGGVTPQQLYVCWRVSRRRLQLRPDLELTLLEGHGIYVVNGFFPALKQSFESPSVLLHWYVVSWAEADCAWAQFLSEVVGAEDPAQANPGTIRGRLQTHWRRYGLNAMPDTVQNGVHVSSGPWHAMSERLKVVQPHLERDAFGDLLLRRKVHRGLIDLWLTNPDLVACGITAGVFEHLAGYNTTQVANLLSAVSDAVQEQVKARMARKAQPWTQALAAATASEPDPALQEARPGDSSLIHPPPTTAELDVVPEGGRNADEEEEEEREEDEIDEALVAHRNAAVLLVKPQVAACPAALQLLRDVLKQRHIRILSETVKDATSVSTARTLDQICFTEAYYGLHSSFVAAAQVSPEFSTDAFVQQFATVFEGESWAEALASMRVLSAAQAMQTLRLTADELYQAHCNNPAVLHVGHSVNFTKLIRDGVEPTAYYVANAAYPYTREHLQYNHSAMASQSDDVTEMRSFVVAWDERELSWAAFKSSVVGAEDPAEAEPNSFRAQLLRQWNVLDLAEPPTATDNGLRVSDGPLQAYAERIAWFGTAVGAIPDTLARSFAVAGADAAQLIEWSENPLVDRGDGTLERLFDVLYDADTADVIAFALAVQDDSSANAANAQRHRVLTASNNLRPYETPEEIEFATLVTRRLREDPFHPQVPRMDAEDRAIAAAISAVAATAALLAAPAEKAPALAPAAAAAATQDSNKEPHAETQAVDAAVDGEVPHAGVDADEQAEKEAEEARGKEAVKKAPLTAAVSRPCQRLQAAKARDILLHARTTEEVQQLWEYYMDLDRSATATANVGKKAINAVGEATLAKLSSRAGAAAAKPTISSATFKTDFTALETYGVPLPRHQVKSLFATAEARGGRMRFDEFARALAIYQAM